jgi:integrase
VVKDYLAAKGIRWRSSHSVRSLQNAFDRWIHPVLGNIDVADIQIQDVARALQSASLAIPATALRLRGHIAAVLTMAAALGYRDPRAPNPASADLLQYKLTLKKPPVVHYPAASLETAPAIFQEVQEAEGSVFRAIEFAILTTVRPGVALRACWSEIDKAKALWVIPAGRMKGGREFTVPLVPAAMAVLAAQERVRAHDYIFPGMLPGRPLCYNVFQNALRKKLNIEGVSLHGFRSVFRDWAGDVADVPRDVAEQQLSHSLGAVEGAYRRLTAIEKRRAVLEMYSRWLAGETASNVVVLRPAAIVGAA